MRLLKDLPINMQPILDKDFVPAIVWVREFLKTAKIPVSIAVERENGLVYRYDTKISESRAESEFYLERLVKMLLWAVGGFKVYIDNADMAGYLRECYSDGGLRSFDKNFMERVYEREFEVICTNAIPRTKAGAQAIGRKLDGNRIGFDAGGSDMKVSAVKDGNVVFSEEIVWHPKQSDDPEYHYRNIKSAIQKALDRFVGADGTPSAADSIGVSSAGIYVANRTRAASLFIKIPQDKFDAKIKDIYINIAKEFNIPVTVANDGDVAALAGSMCLKKNGVLGVAMGTSEAAGYVDRDGKITGWLNELAFAPVDYNTGSVRDEWSGDLGVGCKYFSQDAVVRLAPRAGIELPDGLTPAEKLKEVQKLAEGGHSGARQVFETIGVYFGYAIAYYAQFYDINYLQVLGRVTSGIGGDLIIEYAGKVLDAEFHELAEKITIYVPEEYERRVGQSIAAASL